MGTMGNFREPLSNQELVSRTHEEPHQLSSDLAYPVRIVAQIWTVFTEEKHADDKNSHAKYCLAYEPLDK